MKIDPSSTPVTLTPAVDNRGKPAQTDKSADTDQTNVSLSSRAAELKAMESRLAAIPAVNRAHVDSVKQAISSGQYTINTANIGDNLIDSVKEMLHAAK